MKERYSIDDPALHSLEIFQNLAFAFNNEEVKVTLPEGAFDLPIIEEIDANDPSRIRIIRDCKVSFVHFLYFHISKLFNQM